MLHEGLPGHPMPVDGGIYDQHPELIDQWMEILAVKAKHDKDEQKKRNRQMGGGRR